MSTESLRKLPLPPAEVGALAVDNDLSKCAPKFVERVWTLLHELQRRGFPAKVAEAFRSDERAAFLYGFGREYDDGRGVVTKVKSASKSWHRYGLAVDIVSAEHGYDAPAAFWTALRECATEAGLRSGDDWDRDGVAVEEDPDEHFADKPHVQFGPPMRVTPSDQAWILLERGGVEAVWAAVGAA